MARVISGSGYYMVSPPDGYQGKTYIGGRYVYEHRLIIEQSIGRLLVPGEVIDHKDGNKLNNSLDNLQILDPIAHIKKHYVYRGDNVQCGYCGKTFRVRPFHKKRKKVVFCLRSHYLLYVKEKNSGRHRSILG